MNDTQMAVDMLARSIQKTVKDRAEAIRAITKPGEEDVVVLSAVTLVLGLFLAAASRGDHAHFEAGVDLAASNLRAGESCFAAMVATAAAKAKAAR